ncbi:hypothetical protein Tco_0131710, partial [Tanacetum coccineum]
FSSSSLTSKIMIGSSVGESGVKKSDLVSFKISDKSSSFTFRMESLGADIPGSASAVKSAKASCLDADSECKMKEVDLAGWLGLVFMAELDLVSFFEWPDWDLDALMVDSDVCFEDCFLLSPLLAPGFLPLEPIQLEKSIWELWSPQAHLDCKWPSCGQ